jgi:hypothetical protein
VCSEPLGLGHQFVGGVLQASSFGNQLVSRLRQFLDERCVVRFHGPSCSASAEKLNVNCPVHVSERHHRRQMNCKAVSVRACQES